MAGGDQRTEVVSVDAERFEQFIAPWRNTFPALALAELYASPGEASGLIARSTWVMECCDAVWRAGDERVTTAKLGWWAEEWERALVGQGQHPLSAHLQSARVSAPLLNLLRERDALALNDGQARVAAYQEIGGEIARAFSNGADDVKASTLCWSTLAASRHLAAVWSAHAPAIAALPIDVRARFQLAAGANNATQCQKAAMEGARHTASVLQNAFEQTNPTAWTRQRGMRVLTTIALRELTSLGKPPSRLDALRNAFAAWRAARRIERPA
jgi:hypothetical protein